MDFVLHLEHAGIELSFKAKTESSQNLVSFGSDRH